MEAGRAREQAQMMPMSTSRTLFVPRKAEGVSFRFSVTTGGFGLEMMGGAIYDQSERTQWVQAMSLSLT